MGLNILQHISGRTQDISLNSTTRKRTDYRMNYSPVLHLTPVCHSCNC